MNYNCIFECGPVKCDTSGSVVLNGIICRAHLKEIFGVEVIVHMTDTESDVTYYGPFLRIADKRHMKAKTVIFPIRNYIDQCIGSSEATENFYDHHPNPRLLEYINTTILNDDSKLSRLVREYQLEIIRNLSIINENDIKLSEDGSKTKTELLREVKDRLSSMNRRILHKDYEGLIDSCAFNSLGRGDINLLSLKNNLSPFFMFLVINCLPSQHIPPIMRYGMGTTTYPNMMYENTCGFVTTTQIESPMLLVFAGEVRGNAKYYQSKVSKKSKNFAVSPPMSYKDVADNRRVNLFLSQATDYCGTTGKFRTK